MAGGGIAQLGRGRESVSHEVQAGVGWQKLTPDPNVDRGSPAAPGGEDVRAGGLGGDLLGGEVGRQGGQHQQGAHGTPGPRGPGNRREEAGGSHGN